MKSYENKDIATLIAGAKTSNRAAQSALFDFYAEYLMGIALRYVKDREMAKDVFLMSFEKIFRKIGTYDSSKGAFKSWISRITINQALTQYKREGRKIQDPLDEDLIVSDKSNVLSDLNANQICQMISSLPYPQDVIFNMVIDGYKHKEIALEFGIRESTSRSYFHRGRLSLQMKISKLEKEITIE